MRDGDLAAPRRLVMGIIGNGRKKTKYTIGSLMEKKTLYRRLALRIFGLASLEVKKLVRKCLKAIEAKSGTQMVSLISAVRFVQKVLNRGDLLNE